MNILKGIGGIIAAGITILGSFLFPQANLDPTLGATNQVAGGTYTIAGGGVAPADASFTLQSFTIQQTGQPIVTGNLSSIFYMTIEPGNRTKQEIVGCTTVVQNSSGSATISGCSRGLSPISPYTASTTLAFGHAGGSQVILSDPPQVFNQYPAKDNNETITGTWTTTGGFVDTASTTFTGPVTLNASTTINAGAYSTFNGTTTFSNGLLIASAYDCTVGSINTQVCGKAYIDGQVSAGAANANLTTKGIVQEATITQINAKTDTGSTGAKLFMTPQDFHNSNFASSTETITYATSTAGVIDKVISMNIGDVLMYWGNMSIQSGNCVITTGTAALTYKWSTDSATTTLDSMQGGSGARGCAFTMFGEVVATTTNSLRVEIAATTNLTNQESLMTEYIPVGH